MDDALGNGDDSLWKGLACPPLEEFAFNFDETCYKLDCILDDPLLEGEIEQEHSITTNVRTHCYGNFGKGKELKLNLNMAEIKAFLEEEIEEVVEMKDKKRKIMHDFDCQSVQRKDMMRLNNTNRFVVVDNKRKDDFDLRLEEGHKLHESHESTGQPMQRKDVKRLDHTNRIGVVDNKRKAGSDFRLEASRHKLQETYKSACQPMPREGKMRLNDPNELDVAEKKRETNYNSRFEATTHKLHESYERLREAKQRKQIQVIEFKKLVMEQPKCKAKSKGKSSLRQRLMAMGTHKSNKKFHPFVY